MLKERLCERFPRIGDSLLLTISLLLPKPPAISVNLEECPTISAKSLLGEARSLEDSAANWVKSVYLPESPDYSACAGNPFVAGDEWFTKIVSELRSVVCSFPTSRSENTHNSARPASLCIHPNRSTFLLAPLVLERRPSFVRLGSTACPSGVSCQVHSIMPPRQEEQSQQHFSPRQ